MHAVKTYDVIIIGAGPAGIFTALELADKGFKILMQRKNIGRFRRNDEWNNHLLSIE